MNRVDDFIEHWNFLLESGDIDPGMRALKYYADRFELNLDQQFYICLLFMYTKNVCDVFIISQEFPDFENIDLGRFTDFINTNSKRLQFEKDTVKNKNKMPRFIASLQSKVGDKRLSEYYGEMLGDDGVANFQRLWADFISYAQIGRYMAFFGVESLQKVLGLNIVCNSLFLNDIAGSKSHRNGLCYVLGRPDLVDNKQHPHKYTEAELDYLAKEANKLLATDKIDNAWKENFTLETALCSFKKIVLGKQYNTFYLDREAKQIAKAETLGWVGIDWDVLWQMRQETTKREYLCENFGRKDFKKTAKPVYKATGLLINPNLVDVEVQ